MAANEESIDFAKERGYLSETPRERQVRQYVESAGEAVAMSSRQRWREAKCALSGHRWITT